MSDYSISQIYAQDTRANRQIDRLLEQEGIRRDPNLDYTCGMYDDEMNIIATGSCFGNESGVNIRQFLENIRICHRVKPSFSKCALSFLRRRSNRTVT